jgi:hypothetical protein
VHGAEDIVEDFPIIGVGFELEKIAFHLFKMLDRLGDEILKQRQIGHDILLVSRPIACGGREQVPTAGSHRPDQNLSIS